MDKRKLEVVKQQGNDMLVQTKIDEELLPQAQAVQKQVEAITSLNQGLLWAHNKLVNKIVENDVIGQWRIHYLNILTSKLSGDQARLYLQPTVIAAVAVRDFFSELSADESAWCMKKIFEVVNYEIKRSLNHYDMKDGTCKMKNGKTMMMKNGDKCYMDGKMGTMGKMKM